MYDVVRHRDLLTRGVTPNEIRNSKEWAKPFRGIYILHLDPSAKALMRAALEIGGPSAALSHQSAALVHTLDGADGLPGFWKPKDTKSHVVIPLDRALRQRPGLRLHRADLASNEITTIDGLAVTSIGRTLEDVLLTWPTLAAVVAVECALRRGLITLTELTRRVARLRGRHGVARAFYSLSRVRLGSESAFETISRLELEDRGVEVMEVQYEVLDALGRFVARCDFGFGRNGKVSVVGEADGMATHKEARVHDSQREEAIRLLGYEVVRWTWAQLANEPDAIVRRINAFLALTRG